MKTLSLKLQAVCGGQITDCIESAFRIAVTLGLAYTEFDFNDMNITVYQDGRALCRTKDETFFRARYNNWAAPVGK